MAYFLKLKHDADEQINWWMVRITGQDLKNVYKLVNIPKGS